MDLACLQNVRHLRDDSLRRANSVDVLALQAASKILQTADAVLFEEVVERIDEWGLSHKRQG